MRRRHAPTVALVSNLGAVAVVIVVPIAITATVTRVLRRRPGRKDTLWHRFKRYIIGSGVFGAVLAFAADSDVWILEEPARFLDAAREIGGAFVAGAVLAGLVVWFEDRREDDRIEREIAREDRLETAAQEREDKSARLAWRREVDIQLMGIVHTDLEAGRRAVLATLDGWARKQRIGRVDTATSSDLQARLGDSLARVEALLTFLRYDPLSVAFGRWSKAHSDHMFEVPSPPPEPEPKVPETAGSDPPLGTPVRPSAMYPFDPPGRPAAFRSPLRDPEIHAKSALTERLAWEGFILLLGEYVDERYPIDDDLPPLTSG